MSDGPSPPPRFVVRQWRKGWMVYDQQRQGPTLVGTNPAVNLTKEQAERIYRTPTDEWNSERPT
jgi:hypothetical protein